MDLIGYVRQQILQGNEVIELSQNPSNKDNTFEFNPDKVKRYNVREARTWYEGSSEKLKAFYTQSNLSDFISDPIYLNSKKQYFYSQAALYDKIKLVHSGLPYNIIYTMTNVIGLSKIKYMDNNLQTDDEKSEKNILLQKILRFNEYDATKLNIQEPYTLVEGWGAYKIDYDFQVSRDYPILKYFHAEDVTFVMRNGHIVGFIFISYYKYNDNDYVLLETRRKDGAGKFTLEYKLLKRVQGNEYTPCELNEVPELANLKYDFTKIELNSMFAVPTIYFNDNEENGIFGRSFFTGSVDVFDSIDLMLSMRFYAGQKSAPVEYIPDDMCEHDENDGHPIVPSSFNRVYIPKPTSRSADGTIDTNIQVSQPQIQFGEYDNETKSLYQLALIGKMSPATIGIDLTKRDNAEAQREKEKTTIMTRNTIIRAQEQIDRQVCSDLLNMYYIMHGQFGNLKEYEDNISVEFNEFANPSYEDEMRLLSPLLRQKVISPQRFMDIVYRNKLSKEDYDRELNYIIEKLNESSEKKEEIELPKKDISLDNTNHLNATKEEIFEKQDFKNIVE